MQVSNHPAQAAAKMAGPAQGPQARGQGDPGANGVAGGPPASRGGAEKAGETAEGKRPAVVDLLEAGHFAGRGNAENVLQANFASYLEPDAQAQQQAAVGDGVEAIGQEVAERTAEMLLEADLDEGQEKVVGEALDTFADTLEQVGEGETFEADQVIAQLHEARNELMGVLQEAFGGEEEPEGSPMQQLEQSIAQMIENLETKLSELGTSEAGQANESGDGAEGDEAVAANDEQQAMMSPRPGDPQQGGTVDTLV